LRTLFVNRSYYPDVEATGQLLTELCSDLARRHEITVIAGRPNFVNARHPLADRETHQGVEIVRVRNIRFNKISMAGRALGLASYLLLAFWAALRQKRPDAIVVETDPPALGALGALLKHWHRCPMIFYLQDLFPEVGLALGKFRPGPLTSFLRWLTNIGLRHADRVVVLGEDMKRLVLERGVAADRVVVIPNWADTQALRPTAGPNPLRAEWQVGERFVVMYSGNLGLSQGLDGVLDAAEALCDDPVTFLFVGEGGAKPRLIDRVAERKLSHVHFLPYQPKSRLGDSLAAADLHLIPMRRGLAGCMVPSKLYGILAVGRPYIAAVDADSEVAAVTAMHETGLRIEPESPAELVRTIRWCLAHRAELKGMGERGRKVAESYFDRARSVNLFEELLADLPGRTPQRRQQMSRSLSSSTAVASRPQENEQTSTPRTTWANGAAFPRSERLHPRSGGEPINGCATQLQNARVN
jgi:glycosyltransferase involved in cell wall biosynthesis